MRKRDEIDQPDSCLNKARDNEMLFVIRGDDPSGPATVRAWVADRIKKGRNLPSDPKLIEATLCAMAMETDGKRC